MMRLLLPRRSAIRRVLVAALALLAVAIGAVVLFPAAAFASAVSAVSFTPGNAAAGATSSWTVTFTTATALPKNDTIDMIFNPSFNVSGATAVTFNSGFGTCTPKNSPPAGSDVQVGIAGGSCAIPANTALSLTVPNVVNPTSAGSFAASTFTVKTQTDSTPTAAGAPVLITSAAASTQLFSTSPSNSTAGAAFSNQPVVMIKDQYGNIVTTSSAQVTLSVTGGGAALTCSGSGNPVNASNGVATFAGCSISKAGSYTLTAQTSGLANAASSSFTISAAAAAKLAFVQAPTDAFAGSAMSPAVTVQVTDQFGNAVSSNGVAVTLTPSDGSLAAGASANTNASGLATFDNIVLSGTALGTKLTASASGLTSAVPGAINVTIKVTAASAALTDTAADSGSGISGVSYYYCSGYAGPCTGTSGTLIGASTNAAGNFPVTWGGQPGNGAYRVVAVVSDNVGNNGGASSSTPVTVSN